MVDFYREKICGIFVWDAEKEKENIRKHGISFEAAMGAFKDTGRRIYVDAKHSEQENRFFCLGKVEGKVLTVRFTYRDGRIRIIGAGNWRRGKVIYEKNKDL